MRMKAFCEATGLTRDTVNFYIRLGLLSPSSNGASSNNYRDFDEGQVEVAHMIALAKGLGFTLSQISQLAAQYHAAGLAPQAQIDLLNVQLCRLQKRRIALDAMEDALRTKIARIGNGHPVPTKSRALSQME